VEIKGDIKMNEAGVPRQKGVGEKYCKDCGQLINEKAEICPKCGVRQAPAPLSFGSSAPNGRNRILAALLAFFLGGFGVHKFYLGQIGLGILYLLFCWTLIPVIVALIEFLIFLFMSDEEFNRKYGGA
jgi:TM2 domain-containing membrane protein YozV